MKRLTQFIIEKFRLSKANLDFFDRKNWSIKNAQNGDIVEFIHPDIQIWNKGGKQGETNRGTWCGKGTDYLRVLSQRGLKDEQPVRQTIDGKTLSDANISQNSLVLIASI